MQRARRLITPFCGHESWSHWNGSKSRICHHPQQIGSIIQQSCISCNIRSNPIKSFHYQFSFLYSLVGRTINVWLFLFVFFGMDNSWNSSRRLPLKQRFIHSQDECIPCQWTNIIICVGVKNVHILSIIYMRLLSFALFSPSGTLTTSTSFSGELITAICNPFLFPFCPSSTWGYFSPEWVRVSFSSSLFATVRQSIAFFLRSGDIFG